MNDLTASTLQRWRNTSHVWGQSDCLLSLAEHIVQAGGADYGIQNRGTYSDEAGALRVLAKAGGAVAMIDETGLIATDDPQRGDIVVADFCGLHVGGLHTGQSVAFRRKKGVIEINRKFVKIVKAWKVPHANGLISDFHVGVQHGPC